MAIGAELCDSVLKRIDSREQAVRFERLAHPLGTIRVTPLYVFDLSGDDLSAYKKRLAQQDGYVPPDPKAEPEAYALLNAILEMHVFIYQKTDGKAKEDREPDLSFEIELQTNPSAYGRDRERPEVEASANAGRGATLQLFGSGNTRADSRNFRIFPTIAIQMASIISSSDLLGSEVEDSILSAGEQAVDPMTARRKKPSWHTKSGLKAGLYRLSGTAGIVDCSQRQKECAKHHRIRPRRMFGLVLQVSEQCRGIQEGSGAVMRYASQG